MLSNGLETRLGAFNATYNHFFEWLKVDSEKERPDHQALKEAGTVGESSVRYFIDGLLQKGRLIDYIETSSCSAIRRTRSLPKTTSISE